MKLSMIFIKNKQIKLIAKEFFRSESGDLCPAISDYDLTDFNEVSVISQAIVLITSIVMQCAGKLFKSKHHSREFDYATHRGDLCVESMPATRHLHRAD